MPKVVTTGNNKTQQFLLFFIILLVKKADNSSWFCVNCHSMNAKIIKEKFSILIIDELIKGLNSSKYFPKLDLRSKYHKVHMHLANMEKIAFQRHHGNFEFLIIPFGLTNALFTFQPLTMKCSSHTCANLFWFFPNDILVYICKWVDHLHHLRVVFSLLQHNILFLKETKYIYFLLSLCQIFYLGHVISAKKVMLDIEKIDSMV